MPAALYFSKLFYDDSLGPCPCSSGIADGGLFLNPIRFLCAAAISSSLKLGLARSAIAKISPSSSSQYAFSAVTEVAVLLGVEVLNVILRSIIFHSARYRPAM